MAQRDSREGGIENTVSTIAINWQSTANFKVAGNKCSESFKWICGGIRREKKKNPHPLRIIWNGK